MDKCTAGLLAGTLFFSSVGFSFRSHSERKSKPQDHIWMGSDLAIGAAEAEVRKAIGPQYDFRKADVDKPGKTSWFVTEKGNPSQIAGILTFKEGKLAFVTKRWLRRIDDQEEGVQAARAVYGILTEFVDHGETSCSLGTEQEESPDLSTKVATVTCGQKRLSLLINSAPGEAATVDVNEILQSE